MPLLLATKYSIITFGAIFIFLIWGLPRRIERMRNHGGAVYGAGGQSIIEALRYLVTAFSILAAISGVYIILPFQGKSTPSIILGTITLIIFLIGILLSVYLTIIRPLSGTAPTQQKIYWLLRLLLLGLGFIMFTLASII